MREYKQHILYIVIAAILLSLITINNGSNVSALSYSSSVGVGFTFNPTLSVNILPSDLVIPNLTPGTTDNSNIINVSVATNAAYGYTLSAIMNGDNNDLTHTNGTNTFSSIATDASLSSLTTDNTWGYSYKLSNENVWNNYSGLSTETSKTLVDSNGQTAIPIDFKIGAKAASTQASGTYAGTINFVAVSNVAPMSLLDSFIASGTEQLNGYYKMQDMTHDICESVDIEESELQLIDVRDNKIYWVAKLKDGNCWMTQNLDLDLSHEVALTSETSDIDPTSYGKTIYTAETGYSKDETTNVVSWLPSTIDNDGVQRADTIPMNWTSATTANIPNWTSDANRPYSANAGDSYKYTDNVGNETVYISFESCRTATNDTKGCQHTHIGNYYNWTAAMASNNTTTASGTQTNSVCPKNWNLPASGEYSTLMQSQDIWSGSTNIYTDNGFNNLRASPLYYQRSSNINNGSLNLSSGYGFYWFSKVTSSNKAYRLYFNDNKIWPDDNGGERERGFSIRCIAE